METTKDYFLGDKILIEQPKNSYRAGSDSILLASFTSVKNKTVLELGAGVGVLSICLAFLQSNTKIVALEKNKYFYELLQKNIKENNMEHIITPKLGDIKDINNLEKDFFDVVVFNPPFFKKGKIQLPKSDLKINGNVEQSATLEDFISIALKKLKPKGYIYLIHRTERLQEILAFLYNQGYLDVKILPFYSKVGLAASRIIVKIKKQKGGKTVLCPSKIVHKDDNSFMEDIQDILYNGNSIDF